MSIICYMLLSQFYSFNKWLLPFSFLSCSWNFLLICKSFFTYKENSDCVANIFLLCNLSSDFITFLTVEKFSLLLAKLINQTSYWTFTIQRLTFGKICIFLRTSMIFVVLSVPPCLCQGCVAFHMHLL